MDIDEYGYKMLKYGTRYHISASNILCNIENRCNAALDAEYKKL